MALTAAAGAAARAAAVIGEEEVSEVEEAFGAVVAGARGTWGDSDSGGDFPDGAGRGLDGRCHAIRWTLGTAAGALVRASDKQS